MNETFSTAPVTEVTTAPETVPALPAETSAETLPVTEPEVLETFDTTTETEYIPLEDYYSEPTEVIPDETITVIDYTPVIIDTGNNICSVVLFGCLCICGVLCALRLWGVRSS